MAGLHNVLSSKLIVTNGFSHGGFVIGAKQLRFMSIVRASERDSGQKFEVDRDKAKEALEQLDQQIQSLSNTRPAFPKIKAPDVKFSRDEVLREEPPEISESSLATLAFLLLAFTIFYNVLFYTVIKPSIDGPEPAPASLEDRVPIPEDSIMRFSTSSMPQSVLQQ